jgi:hypothetical protein
MSTTGFERFVFADGSFSYSTLAWNWLAGCLSVNRFFWGKFSSMSLGDCLDIQILWRFLH